MLQDVFSLDVIIPYMENTTEESWCTDVVKTKNGENCLFGHLFDLGGGELFDWFENKEERRIKELQSLDNQIKKISKLKFE